MRNLVIILFALYSSQSLALMVNAEKLYNEGKKKGDVNANAYIAEELYKSKYYFSSVVFAKEHLIEGKTFSTEFENLLEELVLKTGTMSFYGLKAEILEKYPSPSLRFILGLRQFNYKRYDKAIKALENVPNQHRFGPEARFMQGSALNLTNDFEGAKKQYIKCVELASDFEEQSENTKLKRYFAIVKESCIIHQARLLFKDRKYDEALKAYEEIPKTSYRWPYILMEKAWSAYHTGNYNRTLGLLVTYRSPLMTSYFFPEAEVLSSLSYFKLCLWNDSLKLIDQYYNVYRVHSDALKNILLQNKSSHTYFLKLLLAPIKEKEKINPFVRNLMTQIRKKIKFSLDLVNYKKAQNELKYVKKLKSSEFTDKLDEAVTGALAWRTKHLNHYIKKQMFSFINDMHKYSYEMFNIKLEVMSLQRDLVYNNETLISNRSRGSHENVQRSSAEHFYTFNGEFWADELGEYSFGLRSNCKRIDKKQVANSK
jgi:tetratricopeptide (TPR) repeat protein